VQIITCLQQQTNTAHQLSAVTPSIHAGKACGPAVGKLQRWLRDLVRKVVVQLGLLRSYKVEERAGKQAGKTASR
jgi:hypothetical protein